MNESIIKAHYIWRRKVNNHLPNLAFRVFALRKTFYYGCGCHYSLERTLGKIIAFCNDYANPIDVGATVGEEVIFEEFIRTLIRAELSSRGWTLTDKLKP